MSIVTVVSYWHAEKAGLGGGAQDQKALDELTRYIPTETITLFVANVGILSVLSRYWPGVTTIAIYLIWALLTPLIVYLVALGKHKSSNAPGKLPLPVWPMASSTIAFLAWGLAVPGMVSEDLLKVIAAFGALFISKVLSLLEPIFGAR